MLEAREVPTVLPEITVVPGAAAREGWTGGVSIVRGGDTSVPVTVYFTVTGGSAVSGTDFTAMGSSVYLPAATTFSSAILTITADGLFEDQEFIHFAITPDAAYDVGAVGETDVAVFDADGPSVNAAPGAGAAVAGVRAADGAAAVDLPGVWAAGFGGPVGLVSQWASQPGYGPGGTAAGTLMIGQLPYLRTDNTNVAVITAGTGAQIFDGSGTTYTPRHASADALTFQPGTGGGMMGTPGTFTLATAAGATVVFNDFSWSRPAAERGLAATVTDPAGNVATVTARDGAGRPTTLRRTGTVGGAAVTEDYVYAYASGQVTAVTLRRQVGAGSWVTVRTADYAYHDGTTGSGPAGAVKSAAVKDAGGTAVEEAYYRYYTANSSTGYAGAMKFAVRGAAYARYAAWCAANSTTVDGATDGQLAPFADEYFEYGAGGRVTTRATAAGGADAVAYATSGFADGYNSWRTKAVGTAADGTVTTVFANYAGQPMLTAVRPAGGSDEWVIYRKYDSAGRVVLIANPSAVSGYDETYADLVNVVSGNAAYLRDGEGVIETATFGTSTTATSTTAGNVVGYPHQTFVQRGEAGTPVLQGTTLYFSRTDGTITVYPVASTTVYRNDDGTGGQTTSYAYAYFSGTIQPESATVTRPAAATAQNGSNAAESDVAVMDARGRMIWAKDAAGFLTYAEYDDATGGVTKTIRDVDATQTTTFANLPGGWTTPGGGGLHQTTTHELDDQGRPTKTTDPNGNVTYAVYKDADHEVRVYPSWDTGTNAPTGPTRVTREDRARGYAETLTMSATPSVSGGRPTGAESISGVLTLSRQVVNAVGQLVSDDQYTDLTGVTYSQSAVTLGTAGTNYLRTSYAFDATGRPVKTVTPAGTVTRTVSDGLGRPVSTWVGTDDTPTTGAFGPANTAGTNMVQVSATEYDAGGVGDGNVTKVTQIPGGSEPDRVTAYAYDWRNRVVATKAGVETSESTSLNRPLTYAEYDNLNHVVVSEHYDGDGLSITADANTDGVPDRPSSGALRAKAVTSFDEQGRVYRSETYGVDPSSGSVSAYSLRTDFWFNSRGLTIKTSQPGGSVTKSDFDGLGRATKSYTTDGGGDTGYADADDVTGDAVLTQTEPAYDAGGRVLLTTTRQRFHDETGTGVLGTPSTGNKARVSYSANYYDKADRMVAVVDVGTNGGSAYTRPGSVPSRSDTVLVTEYGYNAAGWLETTTDPMGLVSKSYQDNAGRTTKAVENYADGTVSDADDKTVEYTYAANGQRETLKAKLTGGGYQETKWVFGTTSGVYSNELPAETRWPDASTGAASTGEAEPVTYNRLGDVLTKTDRNGTVHTYTYDVLGRQVVDAVTTLGGGVDGSVRRVETNFNTQGNVHQITTFDAATSGSVVNQIQRSYNGLGQLTAEYQATGGSVNTSTTPKVQYAHSEMASAANHSRPLTTTYPNGRVLTQNYAGGVDSAVSRLSSITDGATTLEGYSYLGLGNVVTRSHAETGVDLTYVKLSGESDGAAGDKYVGLDAFGRIIDQRWTTAGGTAKDRFQYGHDRNSNRLYRENLLSAANSEVYAYDGLNQLTSFQRGTLNGGKTALTGAASRSQSWDFDALGNFDSQTTDATTQTRTANKQNEITAVSGATTPTYDANGNLTTDETGKTFAYDAWNRLTEVRDSGGTLLATYKSDGEGRRVSETRSGTTTELIYSDEWQVLEERVSGAAVKSYAWSPVYVDAMIARDRDTDANGSLDERLYPTHDANFNVTGVVTTAGAMAERYQNDPYGTIKVLDTSFGALTGSLYAWIYLHQGGRLDGDSGLIAFRNRELSATLARWSRMDPLGFGARDLNLYRGISNSPITTLDPQGLEASSWFNDFGRWLNRQLDGVRDAVVDIVKNFWQTFLMAADLISSAIWLIDRPFNVIYTPTQTPIWQSRERKKGSGVVFAGQKSGQSTPDPLFPSFK